MEFLNKLYESNYFGIGLFAVISFLVLMFLIVLFFGKKDEKKRKLEETNKFEIPEEEEAFKVTNEAVPVDIDIENKNEPEVIPTLDMAPVSPINYEEEVNTPEEVMGPINEENTIPPIEINEESDAILPFDTISNNESISPIDINSNESVLPFETSVEDFKINEPVINNDFSANLNEVESNIEPTPIINEAAVNLNFMPNLDIQNDLPRRESPEITPIITTPETYDFTVNNNVKTVEPSNFNLNEPIPDIKPVIEEANEPLNVMPTIVEEPVINDTYYKPIETEPETKIDIPNIDFDALAKSISDELDELEKKNEVKVTPMEEIVSKPANDFNSIYIASPTTENKTSPKIDLPTKKSE